MDVTLVELGDGVHGGLGRGGGKESTQLLWSPLHPIAVCDMATMAQANS